MREMNVPTNGNQVGAVGSRAYTPASTAATGGSDFRSLLARLFNQTTDLLRAYADPETEEVNLEGFGIFDKDTPAFQLAAAVRLNDIETQLSNSLSYLDFIYKTLPQMIQKSLG